MVRMAFCVLRKCSFIVILSAAITVSGQQSRRLPPSSAKPSSKPASPASASLPDAGTITDGRYHNPFWGFTYKIPYGWVERTKEMQGDRQPGDEPGKSLVLLAAFERPPQAAGDTVNSAVVIAAESVSSYPGLKTAADYFGPLTELTAGKGFTVVNAPYQFPVGTKQLVRSDFSKTLVKLTMQQASLVTLQKGYILSFTFIGGSEDEVEELIENLSFRLPRKPKVVNSPAPRKSPE